MHGPRVKHITLVFSLLFGAIIPSPTVAEETARAVLDKAVRAAGGVSALERLKGPIMWMERGTFYGMGEAVPFVAQYATRWPAWRQEIENAFAIATNGEQVWVSGAAGERLLEGETKKERLGQIRLTWAERLFPLLDKAVTLKRAEGKRVGSRETVAIHVQHPKHRDATFYFDRETHLLTKIESQVITPQTGSTPVRSELFFSAHKRVAGAKLPSKVTTKYDGKLFVESELVDTKTGATLDPAWFAPPKQ